MRRLDFLALVFANSLLWSGCAPLLLTTGAVGGYAISRDAVTLNLDRSWDEIWTIARDETQRLGRIKEEDRSLGRIEAQIQNADVVVSLEQLTPQTVQVTVRARKYLLPQMKVAQKVIGAIANRL